MAGTVGVGDAAPDFTLPASGGELVTLSDFRGRVVVLAFYPADNSPVCTLQLREYNDDLGEFAELDAQVLALSPQSVDSHDRFSERHGGFGFPLLSDADRTVGRAYGVLGPLGFYRRSVFVVGADGVIRYAHRSATGMTFKRADDVLEAVRASRAADGPAPQ
jgi:thioredoxin-dependent peroxiredoxin